MPNDTISKKLILLSPLDNVLIVSGEISQEEILHVEGDMIPCAVPISMGHKIARTNIGQGQEVIKYGFPIGLASKEIEKCEHVHVHNIVSNYTKTHSLDETNAGMKEKS